MPLSISHYVPQHDGRGRGLAAWGGVVAVAFGLLALIVFVPLAQARGYVTLSDTVHRAFGVVCHQMPERSFDMAGHPLAVCARCFGIYMGFAGGALVYPLARSLKRIDTPARAWLLAALVPTAVDFALDFFGIRENTHLSRFSTGALLGAVSVLYVIPGLVDVSRTGWRQVYKSRSFDERTAS